MGFFLLVLLMAAVLIGGVYYSWLQAKKRRELLQQFALSQGWTWLARDDQWTARFHGEPFAEGDHRKAENVLQGQYHGRSMVAFDYSYETHSHSSKGGETTETHRYAFCAISVPLFMPKLQLTPESAFGRLGTALGVQDIELESEDFNRRYRIQSDNPKFASDALPPRTMERLLGRPALHLRLVGDDAMCWEAGRHTPVQLLARLDALTALLDGIPEFVWTDLKRSST